MAVGRSRPLPIAAGGVKDAVGRTDTIYRRDTGSSPEVRRWMRLAARSHRWPNALIDQKGPEHLRPGSCTNGMLSRSVKTAARLVNGSAGKARRRRCGQPQLLSSRGALGTILTAAPSTQSWSTSRLCELCSAITCLSRMRSDQASRRSCSNGPARPSAHVEVATSSQSTRAGPFRSPSLEGERNGAASREPSIRQTNHQLP